ncbi:MAG TPA: lysophospholipid acyltransferase family protein [Candidatus Limnocylindrales bacterium]
MPRAPEPDPPGIPELPPGLIGRASPRAGIAYRLLRRLWRLIALGLGFRVRVRGLEQLPIDAAGAPRGGYVLAVVPHRTWIDPFLVWGWLPVEPRLAFFGDARTMARSPLRRFVVRRVGGILPIPSHGGPRAFAAHLEGASAVLDTGMVFCLFPEYGPPAPVDQTRPIAAGLGYVALRSGVPIVPVVIGGNHELFWGRRIVVRVLPPLDPLAFAGLPSGAPAPAHGTREERAAAHAIAESFRGVTASAVAAAWRSAEPPAGMRKRMAWLTHVFR